MNFIILNTKIVLLYSAPEVLNKEPLSMATDIWNIGVFAALL